MNKSKPAKSRKSPKSIVKIFVRFNVTLFIVVLTGGLAIAVITLTGIMEPENDSNINPSNNTTSQSTFDDTTIDRLEKLKAINESGKSSQKLPSGRINPFSG